MSANPTQSSDVSTGETTEQAVPSEAAEVPETSASDTSDANAETDAVDSPPEEQTEEEALRETIAQLEEENKELNNRLLRTAAELDNVRRRAKRDKKRRYRAGKVDAIRTLLGVLDDFERSVDAADQMEDVQDVESAYTSLKGGTEMVLQKFRDELKSLGVTPIQAEGEPFDEELHEAMMRQPMADVEPGTVVQEVRKGYRLGDRVIRYSRVIVAMDDEDA